MVISKHTEKRAARYRITEAVRLIQACARTHIAVNVRKAKQIAKINKHFQARRLQRWYRARRFWRQRVAVVWRQTKQREREEDLRWLSHHFRNITAATRIEFHLKKLVDTGRHQHSHIHINSHKSTKEVQNHANCTLQQFVRDRAGGRQPTQIQTVVGRGGYPETYSELYCQVALSTAKRSRTHHPVLDETGSRMQDPLLETQLQEASQTTTCGT